MSIKSVKLDEKDLKILDLLKEHSDFTTRQISKKTLLPITTVHNRILKLRKESVITKYTVELNYEKLDRNFVAYVLISANLKYLKQKSKSQYDLMNEIKRLYFVERVDIVTGGTDLVVVMRVKDVQEFDHCLLTKLQMLEGIDRTQSLIVIHSR